MRGDDDGKRQRPGTGRGRIECAGAQPARTQAGQELTGLSDHGTQEVVLPASLADEARWHARLGRTRAVHVRGIERTAAFLVDHPAAYVAWSGGKDSTIVAHLATTIRPDIVLGHFDAAFNLPETETYLGQIVTERGWELRRYSAGSGSALEEMRRTGTWSHTAETETDGSDFDWQWVTRHGPAAEALTDTGATGYLWGLRAAENQRRRALMSRYRGRHLRASDGIEWCSPIWDWSDLDVWSYFLVHNLPLNPVYAKLDALGVERAGLRVSLVIDPAGLTLGRAMWLRRGWPEVYRQVEAVLPRLREWV